MNNFTLANLDTDYFTTIKLYTKKHGYRDVWIDHSDLEKINQYKWTLVQKLNNLYVRSTVKVNGKTLYLHRFILDIKDNTYEVDHINRDPLDNRRCNLRMVTHQQNTCNKGKNRNSTSGFKGVYQVGNRWRVRIKYNYKSIHMGYFDTKEEAAQAYNEAAIKYHGEFAFLNNI